LQQAGVVPASGMTLKAIACKSTYLFGQKDLMTKKIENC
jgi:hypothetical protein